MINLSARPTFLRRLAGDTKGVAAIEFAMIAPIMIALYVGLAEVSMLITSDRKVSHASSVTGDLAAQYETISNNEMSNIMQAAIAVMGTNHARSAHVSVDIISFEKDNSGTINEVGYAKLGSGFPTKYSAAGVSNKLLNKTSGLVVARVKYVYQSNSREFIGHPSLTETFMLKPRKSATIPFTKGAGSTMTCSLGLANGKSKVTC